MVIYAELHPLLPYSLAFDILLRVENVELEKKVYEIFTNSLPAAKHYANSIDLWVDLEATGNITILTAKQLALILTAALKIDNVMVLNIPHTKLTSDNQIFLKYFLKFKPNTKVIYQSENQTKSRTEKFLYWDCFINPHSLDFENDSGTIFKTLWRLAEFGAEESAFALFEKGLATVQSSYLQNMYLLQLQYMRIASMHYDLAAMEERKIKGDFYDLQQAFYLTKAWGNILNSRNNLPKRIEQAGLYFKLANVHENLLPLNIDELYKMNIFALYKYLNGEADIALNIENKIKKCIANLKIKRPQITYINAMNLARLYRHANDFALAKINYDLAFANAQIHSESHYVYINLCYSMLYDQQEKWQLAFDYWGKAWLQWCRMKTPEALTWRAVRAIGIFDFQPHDVLDTKKIDDCFLKKLNLLADKMISAKVNF